MGLIDSKTKKLIIEYTINYAWIIALIIIVLAAIYGMNIGGVRTP